MDPLMQALLAEEHRKDIFRQIDRIRLEQEALQRAAFRPNWFTLMMNRLGRWLIARGEGLVRRYETPGKMCQPSNQSYAH